MRYPNLRYGNPNEFRHYAQFTTIQDLSRRLRRSERTIRNWLTEAEKLPWWVPEIIRLQNMEHIERLRQMNMRPGPVATVHQLVRAAPPSPAIRTDEPRSAQA